MAFKDLHKRIASDKVLRDKALNIAKNSKHDGYQRGRALMVYKFFNKKSSGANNSSGAFRCARPETSATRDKSAIKSEIM